MATLFGFNAFVRVAVEDPAQPYGTANTTPAQQVDVRLNSAGLQTAQERPRKTNLSVPASGMLASTFDAFRNAGGPIDIPIQYNGSGVFFYLATGTVNTTATGPNHSHVFTPNFDLPAATIQFQRGSNLTNSMEQFTGMMVSSMSISCAAGEELTASFEFIGKDSSTRGGNISSTFPAGDSCLHFEAGNLSLAGTLAPASLEIRSFDLNLDNKLERKNTLGSKLTGEPVISDVREVTMSITADLDDNDILASHLDNKAGNVSLRFSSTADANHMIEFTLTNAVIENYSDAVSSFGRVERTFTIRGLASSGADGFKIEMVNANPSYYLGP